MINEAAANTAQSMQDIVWLIEPKDMRLHDLITRMKRSTEMILGDDHVSVTISSDELRDQKLTLFFLRHFFFAFKETLNNIRKHAGARRVEIHIAAEGKYLSFDVRDDGKGFDIKKVTDMGHGLANLKRRAQRLGGSCIIDSKPERGTHIKFMAPLRSTAE